MAVTLRFVKQTDDIILRLIQVDAYPWIATLLFDQDGSGTIDDSRCSASLVSNLLLTQSYQCLISDWDQLGSDSSSLPL